MDEGIEDRFSPQLREQRLEFRHLLVEEALREVHGVGAERPLQDQGRDAAGRFVSGLVTGSDPDLRDARRSIHGQREIGRVCGFPGQRGRIARIEKIADPDTGRRNRLR